jgi:hypothetical protein
MMTLGALLCPKEVSTKVMKQLFIATFVAMSTPAMAIQVCDRTELRQQCVTRQVCKLICGGVAAAAGRAGRGYGGAAIAGAGGEACSNQCENLPECTTISVCVHSHNEGY